ncbi:Orf18 [Heliothis zea nudivirus]|uniref:Orf18 n=1 Tax=Heliothis zea nudivirus 1 TaxID=3116536 RepID=Q8JKU3_9VIRU|nr:Orf18 [Heliothis zea nudivirus]AAN04313.1 Orf18 [Heliothis zea nudivirus]
MCKLRLPNNNKTAHTHTCIYRCPTRTHYHCYYPQMHMCVYNKNILPSTCRAR